MRAEPPPKERECQDRQQNQQRRQHAGGGAARAEDKQNDKQRTRDPGSERTGKRRAEPCAAVSVALVGGEGRVLARAGDQRTGVAAPVR